MWFATDGTLNRNDGHTFKVFKHQINNANTVSNNLVYDVEEANTGLFKIATGSSLDKFDVKKEIFTYYRPGRDITVNDVLIDSKN